VPLIRGEWANVHETKRTKSTRCRYENERLTIIQPEAAMMFKAIDEQRKKVRNEYEIHR
jgi:hypothetical protein